MAVVCGACSTENRDGAKFCKGCGARLAPVNGAVSAAVSANGTPGEWPATEPVPLRPAAARPEDTTVIVGAVSAPRSPTSLPPTPTPPPPPLVSTPARPPPPAPPTPPRARPAPPPPRPPATAPSPLTARPSVPVPLSPRRRAARSKSMKVGAVLLVALLLAAAGAWYVLEDSGRSERPPAMAATRTQPSPAPVAPTTTGPVAGAAPVAPAPTPAPEATAAAPATPGPAAKPAAPPAPVAAPRPTAAATQPKPRQPTAAAPPPARPEAPATAAAAPPTLTAEPSAMPEPQSQCAGRNFISAAWCMATQCRKPEYRTHAQCEAVRRQQQLEEDKRNPSQLN